MAMKNLAGKTVEVNDEGFLANPNDWTEDMAPELAKEEGINTLTEQHLKVIRFMRQDYKEKGQIPTIRRIKNASGVGVQDLYALFPEGPAKKAAKIAGLGKPVGCV
ncbi:MAG: TusE/DsrC/DsvC family sulfur relay protein [Bacteroidetes bacterium]|nr:TusE/DsrC/DsvC family sulfur relay protein [Bacteroidota bacterium]MCL5737467.1 TusE/DsrC/DsvC family sulfur relay protein [Bacteroidota bacterium]